MQAHRVQSRETSVSDSYLSVQPTLSIGRGFGKLGVSTSGGLSCALIKTMCTLKNMVIECENHLRIDCASR